MDTKQQECGLGSLIEGLLGKTIKSGLLHERDEIYVRNQIYFLFGKLPSEIHVGSSFDNDVSTILDEMVQFAVDSSLIENTYDQKEIFRARIMNTIMPLPSSVNKDFWEKYLFSPKVATDYFYQLSVNSDYIQLNHIRKNITFVYESTYGLMDITINLSKPEKDPKQIEREKSAAKSDYPKCLLCVENEGYPGRVGHPARSNHRMVQLNLSDEAWYLQYSPYVYYDEHCIVLSKSHRDMAINRDAFTRLIEFLKLFPHYFVGSNADLPIVGGSILSHDHYQGGAYELPLARAEVKESFQLADFPTIDVGIVNWPLSVIRLQAKNEEELIKCSDYILQQWKMYSDPKVEILSHTEDIPHNTITPIARMRDGLFEMDLVLRNNRTNDEHPMGIFHPHKDIHHIKKENIGLIEVMGLAVLPGRLKEEIEQIEAYLEGKDGIVAPYHQEWVNELTGLVPEGSAAHEIHHIVQQSLGQKFERALQDAGVFKGDIKGQVAFKKFITSII